MKRATALLPLLAAAGFAGACQSSPATARIEGDVVHVAVGGQPFTTVHSAATPRPYLFPVLGPGGVPMTRSWPMAEAPHEEHDHPHHQSLWFAHGSVNGYDFWQGSHKNERIELAGSIRIEPASDRVRVHASYRWMAEEDAFVLADERTLAFAGGEDARTIDFTLTLTPGDSPVVFGDTKEGTMAVRLHPALQLRGEVAAGTVRNSEGVTGADCWGKRARWVAYSGPIDGRERGVAMFDHPANPRHPTWWHARDYGLFAANPFGVHDFEGKPARTGDLAVAAGEHVAFRYRLVFFAGAWTPERIEAEYADWAR
ncbi:MAG: PmoA family protein [Planctomycetota bacterium]